MTELQSLLERKTTKTNVHAVCWNCCAGFIWNAQSKITMANFMAEKKINAKIVQNINGIITDILSECRAKGETCMESNLGIK